MPDAQHATTNLDTPQAVSDLELAFPATVSYLLPPREEIPPDKWDGRHPYAQLAQCWFTNGFREAYPSWKTGIDGPKAIRHLRCVMGSFEPKHEHKIGGIAVLLERWCNAMLLVHLKGAGTIYTPDKIEQLDSDTVNRLLEATGAP